MVPTQENLTYTCWWSVNVPHAENQVVFRFSYVYVILETSPSRSWVPTYLPTFQI